MNHLSHIASSLDSESNATESANDSVLRQIKKGEIYRLANAKGYSIEVRFLGGVDDELIVRTRVGDKKPSRILTQVFRYKTIERALKAAGLLSWLS